jgi:hypothetical protein
MFALETQTLYLAGASAVKDAGSRKEYTAAFRRLTVLKVFSHDEVFRPTLSFNPGSAPEDVTYELLNFEILLGNVCW